jgi:acyl-CoA synthetase (AMP-forming)/AMP-acid ligase II
MLFYRSDISRTDRSGARQNAGRVAVAFGDENQTFAQVNARAHQFAYSFAALGVRPHTRVALLVNNGLLSVPLDFGCVKAGINRVPAPVYPGTRADAAGFAMLDPDLRCRPERWSVIVLTHRDGEKVIATRDLNAETETTQFRQSRLEFSCSVGDTVQPDDIILPTESMLHSASLIQASCVYRNFVRVDDFSVSRWPSSPPRSSRGCGLKPGTRRFGIS